MEGRESLSCNNMNMITERKTGVGKSCRKEEKGKSGKKPGRKPSSAKVDARMKLERSRQSARECRARKKLRYQYLEELVSNREKAVLLLKKEFEMYRKWALAMDAGNDLQELQAMRKQEAKTSPACSNSTSQSVSNEFSD